MAREGISPLPVSHSPLPWRVQGGYVLTPRGYVVTRVAGFMSDDLSVDGTDAAFICECVNNYDRVLAQRDALLHALQGLTEHYTALVACGDCGNWDAEVESEVIAARAAIALVEKGEGH
jgi:hypothetical protein